MTRRAEFLRVKNGGKSRVGRYVVVSVLRCDDLKHILVGYITTRKVGKANQRNLLRRRFRAILQGIGEAIEPSYYIVTIARWRASEASFEELTRDWMHQARKLGILKPKPEQ